MHRTLAYTLSFLLTVPAVAENGGDVAMPVRQAADMLYELAFANRKT